jgi:hypothetical protein
MSAYPFPRIQPSQQRKFAADLAVVARDFGFHPENEIQHTAESPIYGTVTLTVETYCTRTYCIFVLLPLDIKAPLPEGFSQLCKATLVSEIDRQVVIDKFLEIAKLLQLDTPTTKTP